jgi:hypothetical protein
MLLTAESTEHQYSPHSRIILTIFLQDKNATLLREALPNMIQAHEKLWEQRTHYMKWSVQNG